MSDDRIVVSGLSFSWPDDTPVFSGLSFTVPSSRAGFAASNGAGKPAMFKLIAGRLESALNAFRGAFVVHDERILGEIRVDRGLLETAAPTATR
ncbi:hypothetical protein [Saccharopolyspora elongata]|uniref:hypothetical protein n=1 Tax=Saccharopolyspora elongata TaxID=2530387 RepID=UPI001A9D1F25